MTVLAWLRGKGLVGVPVESTHKHDWVPLYHGGDKQAQFISYRVGEICEKCGVRRYD